MLLIILMCTYVASLCYDFDMASKLCSMYNWNHYMYLVSRAATSLNRWLEAKTRPSRASPGRRSLVFATGGQFLIVSPGRRFLWALYLRFLRETKENELASDFDKEASCASTVTCIPHKDFYGSYVGCGKLWVPSLSPLH